MKERVFIMKLVYNKKSNDPFYYIQEGFRVGNKVKTVTICKLGRHSELAKTHSNPLEYALSVLEEYKNDSKSMVKDELRFNILKAYSLTINVFLALASLFFSIISFIKIVYLSLK